MMYINMAADRCMGVWVQDYLRLSVRQVVVIDLLVFGNLQNMYSHKMPKFGPNGNSVGIFVNFVREDKPHPL